MEIVFDMLRSPLYESGHNHQTARATCVFVQGYIGATRVKTDNTRDAKFSANHTSPPPHKLSHNKPITKPSPTSRPNPEATGAGEDYERARHPVSNPSQTLKTKPMHKNPPSTDNPTRATLLPLLSNTVDAMNLKPAPHEPTRSTVDNILNTTHTRPIKRRNNHHTHNPPTRTPIRANKNHALKI